MSKELAKTYDPSGIEDRLYQKWLDKKYFHAEVDHSKTPFTIVIPPPNITGQLHMGHALDNTMQDILIRYKRMQGYNALWQPGTDHASIATEVKIIQKLKEEGIDKHDLGREKFLERAWEWKKEYGGRIISQLKKLGSSCDWDRERFTMDEGCNKAVTEVFVKMHEKGYIYKGARIVNWLSNRAAQFSPFAALSGHSAALAETARLTDQQIELSDDDKAVLDQKQRILLEHINEHPEIMVTWFQPDEKKDGGQYITTTGRLKRFDESACMLLLKDGSNIPISHIIRLESAYFEGLF